MVHITAMGAPTKHIAKQYYTQTCLKPKRDASKTRDSLVLCIWYSIFGGLSMTILVKMTLDDDSRIGNSDDDPG